MRFLSVLACPAVLVSLLAACAAGGLGGVAALIASAQRAGYSWANGSKGTAVTYAQVLSTYGAAAAEKDEVQQNGVTAYYSGKPVKTPPGTIPCCAL